MHPTQRVGAGGIWTGIFTLIVLVTIVSGCAQAGPLPSSAAETQVEAPTIRALMTSAASASVLPSPPVSTSRPAAPTEPNPTVTRAVPTSSPAATLELRPSVMREVPASPAPSPAKPRSTGTPPPPSPAPAAVPGAPRLDQISLRLETVASGLDRPVFVTNAGDGSGRLFVVEKRGTIRIVEQGQLVSGPFLDLRDRVLSRGSEQGLLGMAFSPDFDQTGIFFVDYTDLSGNTVISRFRVTGDANLADSASEFKVLGIDQPAPNHNGGMIAFGRDGYLYVGTGDGGGANDRYGNGQNPQTLLGKMLRLDVTSDPAKPYIIPPSNPWTAAKWNGQDVRGEIWASGLRNPWRFSFDRNTGDLWIADVGQNQYEEIDRVAADAGGMVQGGLNYGWPIMEGTHCFPDTASCQRAGLTLPVADYAHGADGCSITGGYVYRGDSIPELVGAYLYGDYCSGRIWALAQGPNGDWTSRLLLESGLAISSFGEDQAGELYVADLAGGVLYRLVSG